MEEISNNPLVLLENNAPTPWVNNTYIKFATSDATRKAYRSDIQHFESWGGRLPATSDVIARYLEANATLLNPRTLARRLTALKAWHTYQGFLDPTQHPLVSKTLSGIMRVHGKPKRKALPLTPDDLTLIVKQLQTQDTLSSVRDTALLQIGFFGALRRSELVAIHVEHLKWASEGVEILLPVSKTDQTHEGQYCALPYGNTLLCPVKALEKWLDKANLTSGPIFRRISHDKLGLYALTPLSVQHILRQRAESAGIEHASRFSSHSLRRGLATSAARAGASLPVIMRAGRWKQVATVMEYIEMSERFAQNAAAQVIAGQGKVGFEKTSKR